jgi:hypothetical protein
MSGLSKARQSHLHVVMAGYVEHDESAQAKMLVGTLRILARLA